MSILPLLQALPSSPSDRELEPVLAALLAKAAVRAAPLKSIAATLRTHRTATKLTGQVIAAIMTKAEQEVALLRAAAAPLDDPAEYVGEQRAAAILGISVGDLRARMVDPLQRQAHGYPHWDGREFRFALPALRPATRPAYLAALPEAEPLQDLLPEWCRRSG